MNMTCFKNLMLWFCLALGLTTTGAACRGHTEGNDLMAAALHAAGWDLASTATVLGIIAAVIAILRFVIEVVLPLFRIKR